MVGAVMRGKRRNKWSGALYEAKSRPKGSERIEKLEVR